MIRVACLYLAILFVGLAAHDLVVTYLQVPAILPIGSDLVDGYLPGASRFLETGSPYTAEQIAGPWTLGYHSFIHPPSALPLFIPFLVLPEPLWWAIPLGVTGYAVSRLRPAPWTWVAMAVCLWWPRSVGSLLVGNTDMWAMAAVAAGTLWGWPVVLLAVKPTFLPLAILGVRRRSVALAAGVGLVLIAITLPLWWQWWTVIGNAGLGWTYSLFNLPLVVLPLFAWLGRSSRHAGEDGHGVRLLLDRQPLGHEA